MSVNTVEEPSQIVLFVTEAVPATLIGLTTILLEKDEVHAFEEVTFITTSKLPDEVKVLLALSVVAWEDASPKSQLYAVNVEPLLGVLVLLKVTEGLVKQTVLLGEIVKPAVGAGVLLTVMDKLELAIDVPHELLAKTSRAPLPWVFAAVIFITFVVDETVALIFPVTTHV